MIDFFPRLRDHLICNIRRATPVNAFSGIVACGPSQPRQCDGLGGALASLRLQLLMRPRPVDSLPEPTATGLSRAPASSRKARELAFRTPQRRRYGFCERGPALQGCEATDTNLLLEKGRPALGRRHLRRAKARAVTCCSNVSLAFQCACGSGISGGEGTKQPAQLKPLTINPAASAASLMAGASSI